MIAFTDTTVSLQFIEMGIVVDCWIRKSTHFVTFSKNGQSPNGITKQDTDLSHRPHLAWLVRAIQFHPRNSANHPPFYALAKVYPPPPPPTTTTTDERPHAIACIVCKQDTHKSRVNRGYIAMLSVDRAWRRRGIGEAIAGELGYVVRACADIWAPVYSEEVDRVGGGDHDFPWGRRGTPSLSPP